MNPLLTGRITIIEIIFLAESSLTQE
jgi:hypothetical protein